MDCRFIFRVIPTNEEIVLPVTPSGYTLSHGQRVETVNIHQAGDAVFSGYGALASVSIDCLFPAHPYVFTAVSVGESPDPYAYVERFVRIIDQGYVMRFVVSGSTVNLLCLLEDISYGEMDGTGDVYATLTLREYRELAAPRVDAGTDVGGRPADTDPDPPQTHTVVRGDTLSAISRKYYGTTRLYPQLAKYNGIKNPNLIIIGQVIKLPSKSILEGSA